VTRLANLHIYSRDPELVYMNKLVATLLFRYATHKRSNVDVFSRALLHIDLTSGHTFTLHNQLIHDGKDEYAQKLRTLAKTLHNIIIPDVKVSDIKVEKEYFQSIYQQLKVYNFDVIQLDFV